MRELTYVQALNEALRQAMTEDDSVFMIGENIRGGVRAETAGLDDAFGPERVLDMPISEAAFTGFANGAALAGCGRWWSSRWRPSCSPPSTRS